MNLIPLLLLVSDGAAGESARAQAVALARELDAPLIGVHFLPAWVAPIADVPGAEAVSRQAFETSARNQAAMLMHAAAQAAADAGIHWEPVVMEAPDLVRGVCELAERRHCRLIVVGTDSHNAVWRLLGGDPVPGLISHAPAPLLVCKP